MQAFTTSNTDNSEYLLEMMKLCKVVEIVRTYLIMMMLVNYQKVFLHFPLPLLWSVKLLILEQVLLLMLLQKVLAVTDQE